MVAHHVVIQNRSSMPLTPQQLTAVAAALQVQVDRDFAPAWGARAVIQTLASGTPVPAGTWPMYILDHSDAGLGVHLDSNHHPFAEIQAGDGWTVTVSHELMEMLADPYGNRLIAAPDIAPGSDGHLVNYLMEVCDPCETSTYTINGIEVSDFVLPEYYNEHEAAGTQVDFLRALSHPYEVPAGCYISWRDPADRRWHQKTPDGNFTRSEVQMDAHRNPRDDRDHAFGGEPDERHDLQAIRGLSAATSSADGKAAARP